MENALLRERINDIAAEVAKLAIQLRRTNSRSRPLLAAEPEMPAKATRPANGATANAGVPAEGGGTLAERNQGAAIPRFRAPPAAADLTRASHPV